MTAAARSESPGKRGDILDVASLPTYSPPGHSGTVNIRLVEGSYDGRFELILGTIEPGGVAERHHHATETQIIYVTQGRAGVTLGDAPERVCGPETAIRIPPGVDHRVTSLGPDPLRLVIVYSPPLAR